MLLLEYENVYNYVGTAREIRSLYKNLEKKTSFIPLFVDEPKFNANRMYGIAVDKGNKYYNVVSETDVVYWLIGEVEDLRRKVAL